MYPLKIDRPDHPEIDFRLCIGASNLFLGCAYHFELEREQLRHKGKDAGPPQFSDRDITYDWCEQYFETDDPGLSSEICLFPIDHLEPFDDNMCEGVLTDLRVGIDIDCLRSSDGRERLANSFYKLMVKKADELGIRKTTPVDWGARLRDLCLFRMRKAEIKPDAPLVKEWAELILFDYRGVISKIDATDWSGEDKHQLKNFRSVAEKQADNFQRLCHDTKNRARMKEVFKAAVKVVAKALRKEGKGK